MSHYICDLFIDGIKLLLCFYIYWLSFLHNNSKLELILMNIISILIYSSKYIYRIYYSCTNDNDNHNIWLQIDFVHLLFLSCSILSNIIHYNNIIFTIYLTYVIIIGISYIIHRYSCINQVQDGDDILDNENLEEMNENLEEMNEDLEENNLDLENNIINNKDIICVICLEEFTNRENILQLKCKHYYHKLCLQKWLDSNPKKICPICKYKIME